MNSASFYAAYIVKKLWTLAAILLVMVAVTMSLLRYTLPYLDKQKGQLENWLSNQYGVELAIGELSAGWSGIGPTLLLRDVELKQSEYSPISLNISETQVELDFWGTVLSRQINSKRFELNGMHLTVDLAQIRQSETDFPIVHALESLFLEQLQHFSVQDSQIEVKTVNDAQLIDIQRLSWVNSDRRHQGVGQMRVVELATNSAFFGLDLFGDPESLSGTFYAKGEELDLAPWINQLIKGEQQLNRSRGNFVLWAGIENSTLTGVQVDLGDSQFEWEMPGESVMAAIKGGEIRIVPRHDEWLMNIDNLAMTIDEQSLISSWTGSLNDQGTLTLNGKNSVAVTSLLPALPLFVNQDTTALLKQLSPQARISNIQLMTGEDVAVTFALRELAWQQTDMLPGVESLSGRFNLYNDTISIALSGAPQTLSIDRMLDNDISVDALSAEIFIEAKQDSFDLVIPSLQLKSDTVSANLAMHYDGADDMLRLATSLEPLKIHQAKALFPEELMGKDTYAYLHSALISGQVSDARILWSGQPSQFPFEGDQGVFQAGVTINDAELKFDPGWPALTGLNINLLFENEALYMSSQVGKLKGVELAELYAVIPSLSADSELDIKATAIATGEQLTNLMLVSDMRDSIGEALTSGVNIDGEVETSLHLHIPFSEGEVVAKGTVNLSGNDVYVPAVDLRFSQATGNVSFVNDVVRTEQLKAQLMSQPVTIDFAGKDSKQGYLADIGLTGRWDVSPFLNDAMPAMNDFLQGQVPFTVDVDLALMEDNYKYNFSVSSPLTSLISSLPHPFNKTEGQSLPLLVKGEGNQQASNITASLGRDVKFVGVLPHSEMQFSRAHLSIGKGEFVGLGLGFSISAGLETVEFGQWYDAISAMVSGLPESDKPILSEPERIFVDVEKLRIFGFELDDLELVAKHSTEDWLLEFNADQARAQVTLFDDWDDKGIDIKADFLSLDTVPEQVQQTESDNRALASLPPVTFSCGQCRIFEKQLGSVDFAMHPVSEGMRIDRIRVLNDDGLLQANGDWYINEQGSRSRFTGEFNSGDFGALLKRFDVNSGIKDSSANFEFDLTWQQAPHEFNFDTLNGNVNWGLTDGYLTEVSDKGSRIFSILSLQSLVRKLSLDFRDVFAKGFFYDKMRGSFQLYDGRAETRDTVIDGGAGEMTIEGYTDLTTQSLNYQISFAPNVTSSLPLLVYWMVNPATAIAALAIDQVLTEAKVISNVRYSLTGTIDEPVLSELDRRSKDISLPARNTAPERIEQPEKDDTSSPLPLTDLQPVTIGVENG